MKMFIKNMIAVCFAAAITAGCQKEPLPKVSDTMAKSITGDNSALRDFKIAYFTENQTENPNQGQTSLFAGYRFVFTRIGAVEATKNSRTVKGKWSDDGKNLTMSFEQEFPFTLLSADWSIVRQYQGTIELQNNTDNGREFLIFTKL